MDNEEEEYAFFIIKPSAIKRCLVGRIISKFENKGFKFVELKMLKPSKEILEEHYCHKKECWYYEALMEYMLETPLIVMVLQRKNANLVGRKLLGKVFRYEGSLRLNYGLERCKNVCHGSRNFDQAQNEYKIWFIDDLNEDEDLDHINNKCSKEI
jgi:nucleoside-diphosphate kinase